MPSQLSEHDELVWKLRNHIPEVQGIADRAYAAAGAHGVRHGTRRDMERAGNCAMDLVIALGRLQPD